MPSLTLFPEVLLILALTAPYGVGMVLGLGIGSYPSIVLGEALLVALVCLFFPASMQLLRAGFSPFFFLLVAALIGCSFAGEVWIVYGKLSLKTIRFPAVLPEKLFSTLFFVTLGGLMEEVLYRGFLLYALAGERFSWDKGSMALLVSSIVFAVIHQGMGWRNFFAKLWTGAVYGLGFWLTDSLWLVMIAHSLQNATIILLGRWRKHG